MFIIIIIIIIIMTIIRTVLLITLVMKVSLFADVTARFAMSTGSASLIPEP